MTPSFEISIDRVDTNTMTYSVFANKNKAIKATAHYISAQNQPIFPNVDGNLNSHKLLGLTLLKIERLNT